MYDEVNTRCNLPAQIDIEATEGMEYHFLCVTKGGGSANKTYLYQEMKALLNSDTLVPFLVEKMKTLGTAACPPYHIAFVIGGTSAEKNRGLSRSETKPSPKEVRMDTNYTTRSQKAISGAMQAAAAAGNQIGRAHV